MIKLTAHKIFSIVLIALFLIMQFSLASHASEYGNTPHKHDGKICALTLVSNDDVDDIAILPAVPATLAIPAKPVFTVRYIATRKFILTIRAKAREPPNL